MHLSLYIIFLSSTLATPVPGALSLGVFEDIGKAASQGFSKVFKGSAKKEGAVVASKAASKDVVAPLATSARSASGDILPNAAAAETVVIKAPPTFNDKLITEAKFGVGSAIVLAGVTHVLGGKKPPVPVEIPEVAAPLRTIPLPIPKA